PEYDRVQGRGGHRGPPDRHEHLVVLEARVPPLALRLSGYDHACGLCGLAVRPMSPAPRWRATGRTARAARAFALAGCASAMCACGPRPGPAAHAARTSS